MLVFGEIRTCLLQNSRSAVRAETAELLRLVPGERVRTSERPLAQAMSPDLISGVDCQLPTGSGSRVRGVGTVTARAVVTGGRILQGSVYTRVDHGQSDRRLPWSHYLAKPGVVETTSRFDQGDVINGFFAGSGQSATLDLGGIADRLIGRIQTSSRLDHGTPFKSRRTRFRWAARTREGAQMCTDAEFVIADDTLRTFSVAVDSVPVRSVIELCEDLALHDWILTTVLQLVERSDLGSTGDLESTMRLRPAVDHLLHLWMPGARVADALVPLWESLERRPGFTRQWQATVGRIRDRFSAHTLGILGSQC